MLDLGQLGFSCPVNWKQSSFVGPGLLISNNDYQVHIDDYMFNKDVLNDNSTNFKSQYQSVTMSVTSENGLYL